MNRPLYGLYKISILIGPSTLWTSFHPSWMDRPLYGLNKISFLLGWTVHFMDSIKFHRKHISHI